jgi:peptidoglycan/xylan/chitin deacetylase (PgdA/CDA1 family)
MLNGAEWVPPIHLADPPVSPWSRELAARAALALGGVRVSEILGHHIEFCRPAGDFVPRYCRAAQSRFAMLCYHRVGQGGVPLFSGLPALVFEAQMNYLRRHYRVVPLYQALSEMSDRRSAAPTVVVTFDDGYADLYTHAFPVLQRHEIPAMIFLTVGAIESGEVAWYDRVFVAFQAAHGALLELPTNPPLIMSLGTPEERLHSAVKFISLMRKLPAAEQRACCTKLESIVSLPRKSIADRMLSWEQIRHMQAGGVSFGAHTMTHPVVSRLTEQELYWELGESKRILEDRLQRPVLDFAFPFGKSDECGDAAVKCLASLGFRSAATTIEGLNRPAMSPFALRRVSFCEDASLAIFAVRLARLFLSNEQN